MLIYPEQEQEWRSVYRILTALVQPRPIAWVSSISAQGKANLAPFSFFNVVCAKPATIVFCPMLAGPQGVKKDTVRNIEETRQFVIQVVSRDLAEAMNATSCEVAADVDEFELAGLTKASARVVKVPRVAEAKAYIECEMNQVIPVGQGSGAGCLILGEVVCMEVRDEIMDPGDRVSLERLQPIGRLSGSDYSVVRETFSLDRPTPEEMSRPAR